MANMSYCRHENTAADLADVVYQWNDWLESLHPLSADSSEARARVRILELAAQLVEAAQREGVLSENFEIQDTAKDALTELPLEERW